MAEMKIALSIEEAADYTGIGRNTLRKLVEWDKLPVLKVGRKVLIKKDILELFMTVNEGRDLRDRGNVKPSQERRRYKSQANSCGELKKYNHFWKMNLKSAITLNKVS